MSLFIYINMSLRNQIEVLSERHPDACLKVIILFVHFLPLEQQFFLHSNMKSR